MKLLKKIIKIFKILTISSLFIIIIDFHLTKINSVEDISNLTKIKMYDNQNEVFYEINNLHESSYVNLENISENIIKTVIEIEDKRFYKHSGFDIYRITKAIINNLSGKPIIGASTITQQYIKNIYLTNEKSMRRKLNELYYAIKLEGIYEKNEILEGYLNTIYFNHGIYGIYDAAKYYFNKEPKDITLKEAAILIAIIKSPKNYSPILNKENNTRRVEIILNTLYANKIITIEQYKEALNEEVIITKTKYKKYESSVLFYKDFVLNEMQKTALKGQNINIYTNFDSNINTFINNYIKTNSISSDLGIVVMDSEGKMVASTSKDYYSDSYNSTTNTKRMIGSTIKPMLYYEALNYGMSPISKFISEPTTFYINKNKYEFQNYNKKYQNGKITMGYALATSDNIYAVKTHLYIGSNKLISFLKKFYIKVKDNYPSLALGSVEMSLIELTSIYNTFSRLGKYNTLQTIKHINIGDKFYKINHPKEKQLLKQDNSFVINDMLALTFDTNLGGNINVTGASIANKLNTKASGKSGLTDFDSYFSGYTPEYPVGIWTGNNDHSPHNDTISKNFPKEAFLHIINFLSNDTTNTWYKEPSGVYSLFISPTGFNDNYLKKVYFILFAYFINNYNFFTNYIVVWNITWFLMPCLLRQILLWISTDKYLLQSLPEMWVIVTDN